MDLQMPKPDGWDALAMGACSFLMKPCFPEQLVREVARHLRNQPRGRGDRPAQRVIGGATE